MNQTSQNQTPTEKNDADNNIQAVTILFGFVGSVGLLYLLYLLYKHCKRKCKNQQPIQVNDEQNQQPKNIPQGNNIIDSFKLENVQHLKKQNKQNNNNIINLYDINIEDAEDAEDFNNQMRQQREPSNRRFSVVSNVGSEGVVQNMKNNDQVKRGLGGHEAKLTLFVNRK